MKNLIALLAALGIGFAVGWTASDSRTPDPAHSVTFDPRQPIHVGELDVTAHRTHLLQPVSVHVGGQVRHLSDEQPTHFIYFHRGDIAIHAVFKGK